MNDKEIIFNKVQQKYEPGLSKQKAVDLDKQVKIALMNKDKYEYKNYCKTFFKRKREQEETKNHFISLETKEDGIKKGAQEIVAQGKNDRNKNEPELEHIYNIIYFDPNGIDSEEQKEKYDIIFNLIVSSMMQYATDSFDNWAESRLNCLKMIGQKDSNFFVEEVQSYGLDQIVNVLCEKDNELSKQFKEFGEFINFMQNKALKNNSVNNHHKTNHKIL